MGWWVGGLVGGRMQGNDRSLIVGHVVVCFAEKAYVE